MRTIFECAEICGGVLSSNCVFCYPWNGGNINDLWKQKDEKKVLSELRSVELHSLVEYVNDDIFLSDVPCKIYISMYELHELVRMFDIYFIPPP